MLHALKFLANAYMSVYITLQLCLPDRFFSMSVLTFLVRFILGKIAGCAYIKLIQYFCGALDCKHYYDIQRWRFVSNVGTKVAYLNRFFLWRENLKTMFVYI